MESVTMKFPVAEAYPLALAHFLRISGLRAGSDKHERMKKQALDVFEDMKERIRLQAFVSAYRPQALAGNVLTLSDVGFRCGAFEQLRQEEVRRCYVYLLTAGEPEPFGERLTDLLFADIWATSFIEAGRQLLRERVATLASNEESKGVLTDSFGPGYYGMQLEEVGNFFKVLDAEAIQVRLHESGVILPVKTCTGMFLLLNEGSQIPPVSCEGCLGNAGGCQFCAAFAKREG